jgi:hypothetical protein
VCECIQPRPLAQHLLPLPPRPLPRLSLASSSSSSTPLYVLLVAQFLHFPPQIYLSFCQFQAKIKIIKEVRELTKLDLKAAKDLVEAAPKTLIKDLKKDEADKAMEKLKAAGAVCELEVRFPLSDFASFRLLLICFVWVIQCVNVKLSIYLYFLLVSVNGCSNA